MKIKPYHVKIAAEAVAASLFARCGYDVSIQYGADQPDYDLIIAKEDKIIKVSVKGSQDGSWGLTQSYIKKADYHGAVDTWLSRQNKKTLFCFVQFKNVSVTETPRVYLAWSQQIAERLKKTAKGRGDSILYEKQVWTERAYASGTTDKIPDSWRFSHKLLDSLFI